MNSRFPSLLGGTGNHPLNGSSRHTRASNASRLRNATSLGEVYRPDMVIQGKRYTAQLPTVRHGEVAGKHGNRMTMTNTTDTVGHGGYRRRVAAEAQKLFGRNATAKGQYMEQAMKAHHKASQEAKRRKYEPLK